MDHINFIDRYKADHLVQSMYKLYHITCEAEEGLNVWVCAMAMVHCMDRLHKCKSLILLILYVNTTPILFTLYASNKSVTSHKLTTFLSPSLPLSLLPHFLSLSLPVRTSSLSTFDSIELGRYSDDLDKENDDRVAVLEFELRKAYETIKSLRGSLTEAATGVVVLL